MQIIQNAHPTLDLWLRAITAASTLLIGVAASFLAYRQYRISMSKLKFDLYEKRFAVFQATKDYFMAFDFYGQNNILKLRRETSERHFLFGRDVNAFFDEIERRQSAYEDVKNLELPRKDLVENSDIIRERHAAASKPILDLYDELINAFSKDLALRTLR